MQGNPIPRPVLWLGLLGLLPFFGSAALIGAGSPWIAQIGAASFAIYGAVILSFLGGVRWGLEIAREPSAPVAARLVFSVLASLVGWALALWIVLGGGALIATGTAAAFAAQFIWDRAAGAEGLAPRWYPRLRLILTSGVLAACLAIPILSLLDVR
ncbi:MAG: DUF3429 domain-containing protein [Caulobacterales bacterium]